MPSRWLAFDRIRALSARHGLYHGERLFQDQPNLERLMAGGSILNPNSQNSIILDQTNLHLNRLERYKDYEQMDQTGEITLALDLYADESALVDAERKHTLIIRAHSRRLKRELEELYFGTLQWDNNCRSASRYLCKFGDCPYEIVPDRNRGGIAALKHVNVYNFTRVETKYGDLVGFFYQDELQTKPEFLHPWQIAHLRLTSLENIYAPYGRSVIDGGRKAFKQLRLMEDSALIYRITRAPEKRKFTVPVGMIPHKETMEYVAEFARTMKRHRFYNPATGTFDEQYSPLIQEDDFYLPRRADGTGPDIEVLPGGENMDKIADIEYFKKKMIAPTKIPFARVGIGEGAGEPNEKSLSQSSSEFAKAIQWVQRELVSGLTKVGICHLAMRGYPIEDIKGFELAMSATSAMEELYRMETWQTRVGVMLELKELGWFPKEWIITHFTDLTPDEIEELKEMEALAVAAGDPLNNGGEQQGGGAGGMPPMGGEDMDLGATGGDEAGMDLDLDPADDAGGGEADVPPAPPAAEEGWDRRAQLRVLREMRLLKRRKSKQALREYIERIANRRKDSVGTTMELNSQYNYIMENRELDGLTKLDAESREEQVLVECSVATSDAETAKRIAMSQLMAPVEQPVVNEEITMADLPPSF
jgi:hypothetical protein